jgi:hypothetical protein
MSLIAEWRWTDGWELACSDDDYGTVKEHSTLQLRLTVLPRVHWHGAREASVREGMLPRGSRSQSVNKTKLVRPAAA